MRQIKVVVVVVQDEDLCHTLTHNMLLSVVVPKQYNICLPSSLTHFSPTTECDHNTHTHSQKHKFSMVSVVVIERKT